jgi:hypothetical protein
MAAAAQDQVSGSVLQQRLGAFRSRDFRLLWIGSVISNVGTWMHIISHGSRYADIRRNIGNSERDGVTRSRTSTQRR